MHLPALFSVLAVLVVLVVLGAGRAAEAQAPALKIHAPSQVVSLRETLVAQRAVLANIPGGVRHAVSCRSVRGLPHTTLCVFESKASMNAALNRASEYLETKRGLLSDREHATNPKNDNIDGHDILIGDLRRFVRARDAGSKQMRAQPAPSESAWVIAVENEFVDSYLRRLLRTAQPADVLLGIAADTDDGALHHEVLHAAFFTNAEYRHAVELFWNKRLSVQQRDAIKAVLHDVAGYDVTDKKLVLNELQAYLLMTGARKELLARYVDELAPLLDRALRSRGTPPPSL